MISPEIETTIQQFFISSSSNRKDELQKNVTKALNELESRNMLLSSEGVNKISKVYADELRFRFEAAWESIKSLFDKRKISFSKEVTNEIEELLKWHVTDEIKKLSREINGMFRQRNGPLDFQNSILTAMASARNSIFPKLTADLNFYTTTESDTNTDIKIYTQERTYVDIQRIKELKSITNQKFDLARLIRLCEEINVAYQYDCFMTVAMGVRAIIDHVPPIFDKSSFHAVASNYSGSKSFKESIQLLERSLRNVADAHLHLHIRRKEILPTFIQVNFKADLDVLLAEIIRILK